MKRNGYVLILGATGTVGREVVEATVAHGADVRAFVRSSSKLSVPSGVQILEGDLRDEASLARAVAGARSVFYASPHEHDEEELAARVIRACEDAGARLVFVGVHADGSSRPARALRRFVFGRMLPHYRPKLRLSERVRTSKADPVLLLATNYFQNDELFRPDITAGVFPIGFERPVNRVDVRDIAAAAARALVDETLPSGAYDVVGPASLSSADCAKTWGEVLGHAVREDGDEARFRARVERAVQGRKREDFLASFAFLRRFELATDPRGLAVTTRLLGRPPTSYRDYVERTARAWSREERANRVPERPKPSIAYTP